MSTGHSRHYTDIRRFPFMAVTSSSVWSYLIIMSSALWTTGWRSNNWAMVEIQRMAAHTHVGQVYTEKQKQEWSWLPAHLPASEAAPKWFEDYHDVNICGFDCIMGRSNAGRWSVCGKTESQGIRSSSPHQVCQSYLKCTTKIRFTEIRAKKKKKKTYL